MLHFFVSGTKHLAERSDLPGSSFLVRRFLEVTLGASIANDALAIQTLLQSPNRAIHRFSLTDFY
ncbi:uncharacterized protein METZ01_LOCUS484082, partial [marine metagenome]